MLPATAAVVTVVLVGTSAPAQVFHAQGSSDASASQRAAGRAKAFGIRVGSATGLRPGGQTAVPLRYSNPFRHRLVVRSQTIEVTSAARTCPAEFVDLTQARAVLARPVTVPARGAATLDVVLSMRSDAPEGCQGVSFTTTVRAQGHKR